MPQRSTGRLSGPSKGTGFDFEGLGPLITVLVAVHVAALVFWIVSLIKGSFSKKSKPSTKQH